MSLKNIIFPNRRQKIRSQKVLAAQQKAYSNSIRNLRLAQFIFFLELLHVFFKK